MLLRALLSAFMGTAAMTLSSTVEMDARGREPSTAPGRAANRLLRLVGVPELKGPPLHVLSDVTHWAYGTAWGVVFWLLVDVAGLSLPTAGPLFFLIVWGTAQVQLPLLGIAPPSWRWGIKEVLIDLWHHVVYAAATVGGWVLVRVAGA
ncbi:MAG: hypothetical protein ACRDHV_07130 [Actinomycetota bacterium]